MRRPTLLPLLLSYILISRVKAATRSSLRDITPEQQNTTISNVSSLSGNPGDLPLPWGPQDFKIEQDATRYPIPRNETFMVVLHLLAEETPQDFNGRLSEARITYRSPLCPNVAISVASTRSDRRVPRKYLFWTIARVLDFFNKADTFTSANVVMKLRGLKVGTVFFIAKESDALNAARLNSGFQDRVLTYSSLQRSLDNTTIASFGSDDIVFRFEFYGEPLKMENIFMATVAGLIDVAQQDQHPFDFFVGSCPRYDAFISFYASPRPSRLTKLLLIQSIVASVFYSHRMGKWHELSTVTYVDLRQVASGGYTGHARRPHGLFGSSSLS